MSDVNDSSHYRKDFDRNDLIAAARKLWGTETSRPTRTEWRFGSHGSKSIKLDDLVWHDHETGEGGGVATLMKLARMDGTGAHHQEKTKEQEKPNIYYSYKDESGDELFQVVRQPGHKFLQRHQLPDGTWTWNVKGVRRVLYRLPELTRSANTVTVFVVEGEKDANNLAQLGTVTTTNPGGAGKWRNEYSEFLRDRSVVILPDNDAPGRAHADQVAAAIAGTARSVKIVELPSLGPKEDVSDWIRRGGTLEALEALVIETGETGPEAPQRRRRRANGPQAPAADWIRLCATGRYGVLQTTENAYIAMANDNVLKTAVRFNEMIRIITIEHTILNEADNRQYPRVFEDTDYTTIQIHMQRSGLKTIGIHSVQHAVEKYAAANPYHPLRDWIETLVWDGTKRMTSWIPHTLGVEDNEYHRAIGQMFIVAMAARILDPGCKADYMLVLEGEQGELKSQLCQMLAGKDWFSDNLPDITASAKDASQHLRGKWLIEIAEMHAFNRAESTHLKQFITRTHERYRPPYGRGEVIEPRQTLFIGTTNKEVYLKDETGGRRFWPIKTGDISLDWLEQNRDQLFAEAVMAWREGCPWWPTREFEREYIREHQEARFDADAWEEPIQRFINTKSNVTILEVAIGALGYDTGPHTRATPGGADDEEGPRYSGTDDGAAEPGFNPYAPPRAGTPINRLGRADQLRIAAVLTALGWERAPRTHHGTRRPWRPRKARASQGD
jgi:predicted P-loop ATPase